MRYLYICNGTCGPDDLLSEFRLIPQGRSVWSDHMIRVRIPSDVQMERSNGYYTTGDARLISDFEPVVVVRFNSKLRIDIKLTQSWKSGLRPHQFGDAMRERGYTGAIRFGYLNPNQYAFYYANTNKAYQITKIPKDTDNFDGFWKVEDYALHMQYVDIVRRILQSDDKYASLRNLSDEWIMDFYGRICFFCTCDSKLKVLSDATIMEELSLQFPLYARFNLG